MRSLWRVLGPNRGNLITQKVALFFSGMPQSFLKSNPGRNTEIVSLSIEGCFYPYAETQQLLTLTPYNNSINHL